MRQGEQQVTGEVVDKGIVQCPKDLRDSLLSSLLPG